MNADDRRAACVAAGLDPKHAHRLQGESADELRVDAEALRDLLPSPKPTGDEMMRSKLPPRTMVDLPVPDGTPSLGEDASAWMRRRGRETNYQ